VAPPPRLGRRVAVVPPGSVGRRRPRRPLVAPGGRSLIGAGAILDRLPGRRAPEAELAVAAFRAVRSRLPAFLLACSSGREHAGKGTEGDVALAAHLDVSDFAPRLVAGAYVAGAGDAP
jgi:2-phosphosulfolactate phosphatase